MSATSSRRWPSASSLLPFFVPWFLTTLVGLTIWRWVFRFFPRSDWLYLVYVAGAVWWIYLAFAYAVGRIRRRVLQELEAHRAASGDPSAN